MKKAIATIAITLALAGFAQARKVVVLSPEEIASGVQRAVSGVPVLRSAMKDPDSFVLEGVWLRPPNKQGISDVCYSYRARNSYGGYAGTGTARLNSQGVIDSFGSSADDEMVQVLMACSSFDHPRSLNVTAQVNAILHPVAPAPVTPPTLTPAEQAKQAQQHADCLKAAVDNPSIVCK